MANIILKKLKAILKKASEVERDKLHKLQQKYGVMGSLDDPAIVKAILQKHADEEIKSAIDELA